MMSSNCVGVVTSDEASSVCSDSTYQCSECRVDTGSCSHECEAAVGQQVRLEAEIKSLISEREEMKSKICNTEEIIAALETQLLDTKSVLRQLKKTDLLCSTCNIIKDPRQRKQIILQEIYREVLKEKPQEMLCMFGLFKQLEDMINQGVMDTQVVPVEYLRCRKCHQVVGNSEAKSLLVFDLADVLSEMVEQITLGCSGDGVCGECLAYVRRFLHCPSLETSSVENTMLSNLGEGVETDVNELIGNSDETRHKEVQVDISIDDAKLVEITKKFHDQAEENVVLANDIEMLRKKVSVLQNNIDETSSLHNVVKDLCNKFEDKFQIKPKLTKYNGEVWEDAKCVLLSWEYELETLHIPKSKWTLLASRTLTGKAQDWWVCCGNPIQVTWEEFKKGFLKHFNDKMVIHNYMSVIANSLEQDVLSSNPYEYNHPSTPSILTSSEKCQIVRCISRILGHNEKSVLSIFNHIKIHCPTFGEFKSLNCIMAVAHSDTKDDKDHNAFWFLLLRQVLKAEKYWKQ